jgi:hypothetical protein
VADLHMVGTKHVTPLVAIRLDRVTLGVPCRVSSLNAISGTFRDYYEAGLATHPYSEDYVLEETYRTFQQALRDFLFGHPHVKPWKPHKGKCPRQTFELIGGDDRRAALVHIGSAYGTPYVHFEFNPSEMTHAGRDSLLALLADVFADGYRSLYEHGVVVPLECAVDINGLHCADAVLIDLGKRNTRPYGNTSTVYCGRRGGPLQGKLYDKASEMGGKFVRTRWETTITDRHATFSELVEGPYPCPLKDFRLVRMQSLKECLKAVGQPTSLAVHIRGLGLRKAIPSLKTRKALIAKLEQHAYPWSHPTALWSSFMQLLERFEPASHPSGSPVVKSTSTWCQATSGTDSLTTLRIDPHDSLG